MYEKDLYYMIAWSSFYFTFCLPFQGMSLCTLAILSDSFILRNHSLRTTTN